MSEASHRVTVVGAHPAPSFTSTSQDILHKDSVYWLGMLSGLMDQYRVTKLDSEDARLLKASVCAKIAGHAYSMAEHFDAGVVQLAHLEDDKEMDFLSEQAAIKSESGEKHSAGLNAEAVRIQS